MSNSVQAPVQIPTRIQALVVEDDLVSRKALIQILTLHGIAAAGVSSRGEAIAALAQNPAAIILDLMLPDGNGMDVLKQVRQQKLAIRVAVLTGADKPMIAQAQAMGPDAVFTKPVDLVRLLEWLKDA